MARGRTIIAVDFGSTYTKLAGVNADGTLAAAEYVPTTTSGVEAGFRQAMKLLARSVEVKSPSFYVCSSANGGLRIAVVGLVKSLSMAAAEQAALGAGGKIVAGYARRLTSRDVADIVRCEPDAVLLSGGFDGGDENTITHNAEILAEHLCDIPVIVAGNVAAADRCTAALEERGIHALVTSNLLPEPDTVNAAPVTASIRKLFMERIARAKGLQQVISSIPSPAPVVPTPVAALRGAQALRDALGRDLLVVDVGGATTDVHSVTYDAKAGSSGAILKGLPEPEVKRTVEGDLGVRANIDTIVSAMGIKGLTERARELAPVAEAETRSFIAKISLHGATVPSSPAEAAVDAAMARFAVSLAVQRHAGYRKRVGIGRINQLVQYGKDLGHVAFTVGVGGVLAHGPHSEFVLQGVYDYRHDNDYELLTPSPGENTVDKEYVLFAAGLLAPYETKIAMRLAEGLLV